jgi:hypothetical protein
MFNLPLLELRSCSRHDLAEWAIACICGYLIEEGFPANR